jgi:hypothetical protein
MVPKNVYLHAWENMLRHLITKIFGIGTLLRLKPKSRNLLSFLAHKPEFYLVIVDFSQKYARLYALCDTLFMSTWLAFYSAQYYLCHFGHELERPAAVLI